MSKGNFVNNEIYGAHLSPGRRQAYNPVQDWQWMEELMYRRIISELAMARFKWSNLPAGIDPRYMEYLCFHDALCIFTKMSNPLYGERYFALKGSGAGRIDPYDNPSEFTIANNGNANTRLPTKVRRADAVPIWANAMREPDWDVVQVFSYKLARISRSIDIAELNMRNTNFVYVTENMQLSMQNIMAQRDKGEATVYLKKSNGAQGIQPEDITAIDMKVHPDTLPKLMLAKSKLWNECMTLLGVNNANQDKAERVQAAEVSANDDQVGTMRRIALNSREQAVEEINKKWGLNIKVEFHMEAMAAAQESAQQELGGLAGGDVHEETAPGNNGEA